MILIYLYLDEVGEVSTMIVGHSDSKRCLAHASSTSFQRLLFCHRFPVRAVERFAGPFDHKLANTIIVLGNKVNASRCCYAVSRLMPATQLDPVTPFVNAQKIAATLGSSARLLEQDGIGVSGLILSYNDVPDVLDCQSSIRHSLRIQIVPRKLLGTTFCMGRYVNLAHDTVYLFANQYRSSLKKAKYVLRIRHCFLRTIR